MSGALDLSSLILTLSLTTKGKPKEINFEVAFVIVFAVAQKLFEELVEPDCNSLNFSALGKVRLAISKPRKESKCCGCDFYRAFQNG